MAWALAVIFLLGVGLPIAAWRLSRQLESRLQPVGGVGPPTDQVDKWLLEQHHLPAVQRRQVRDAVMYGRMVRDPALKHATRDVAGKGGARDENNSARAGKGLPAQRVSRRC